jgi:hypothetical protein
MPLTTSFSSAASWPRAPFQGSGDRTELLAVSLVSPSEAPGLPHEAAKLPSADPNLRANVVKLQSPVRL